MFRTKKDVDRHAREVLKKYKDENERNRRCYNLARLYFQIGDYESSRRYVSGYLSVCENSAEAHKLLGRSLEALGQKEKALAEYKCSLELESNQKDLVLKVCELLCECESVDVSRARYWCERAENMFPHNPVVFKLKELILVADGEQDASELEKLITSELTARPTDPNTRIRLLRLFLDTERVADAYHHALEVEKRRIFRDNLQWYDCLVEVYELYLQESRNRDAEFYRQYLNVLDRVVFLSLDEQALFTESKQKQSIADCVGALHTFDLTLHKISQNVVPSGDQDFYLEYLKHMRGQLCFHLATLILKRAKKEPSTWREASRMAAPLLMLAMVLPPDLHSYWLLKSSESRKSEIKHLAKEASFRVSQAGHTLLGICGEKRSQFLDRVSKFCAGKWRERIYQRVFSTRDQQKEMGSSHFVQFAGFEELPMHLPNGVELRSHDEEAQKLVPGSLHHLVWLGLHSMGNSKKLSPDFRSQVFEGLQSSVNNLNCAGAETLNKLDIDAFLHVTVMCAAALREDHHANFYSTDKPTCLPVVITEQLCSTAQAEWWSAAYKLFTNAAREGLGQLRLRLQRGIEVIRGLSNHGLDVRFIVHLAEVFAERAATLESQTEMIASEEVKALNTRAAHYWSIAIPLLQKLSRGQPLRPPQTRLFECTGKELSASEISSFLENGKFFVACQLMKENKHEEALQAFQELKSPHASFFQAMIYKKLAAEEVENKRRETITSEMRSQHIILLTRARECLYLTLDRLRSPGVDRKHPLNSELANHIEEIESQLSRIDPDGWRSDVNRNECDGMSDDSVCSNPSGDNVNATSNYHSLFLYNTFTPKRGQKHSTPFRNHRMENSEAEDTRRTEARPSPERLDAQIRHLVYCKDTIVQTILDQNKALLETNKAIVEELKENKVMVEELRNQLKELRKETMKIRQGYRSPVAGRQQPSADAAAQNFESQDLEDDMYMFADEEEYREEPGIPTPATYPAFPNYPNYPYRQMTGVQGSATVTYGAPHTSGAQAPLLPPGMSNFFQMRRAMDGLVPAIYPLPYYGQGALPFSEGQQLPDFHANARLPATAVPPHAAGSVFSRLGPAAGVSPTESPSHVQAQEVKPVPPTTQAAPVNVVITSSDTLPTTAPSSQPPLSVTIPPQHRRGTVTVAPTTSANTAPQTPPKMNEAPHDFQISMPPQAQIPTSSPLEKGLQNPVLPISTQTLLSSVPSPVYSAVTADKTPTKDAESKPSPQPIRGHRLSTDSGGDTHAEEEEENDPCPDYQPMIPLPAEVMVQTGEEEEVVLFESRAKLYRFVEKEWKERGIGSIKILHNQATNKVRILMRREQVFKICANHFLTPDMKLSPINIDKAWLWVANDFADEEMKLEKLCARFKTAEQAQDFKEAFEKAQKIVEDSQEETKPKEQVKESVPSDKATSKELADKAGTKVTFCFSPSPQTTTTVTTTTATSNSNINKLIFGGFSFMSQPAFLPKDPPEEKKETVKEKPEETKPSPFASFSFGSPESSSKPNLFAGLQLKDSVTKEDAAPKKSEPALQTTAAPSKPDGGLLFESSPVTQLSFSTLSSQNNDYDFKKDANFKGWEGTGQKLFESQKKSPGKGTSSEQVEDFEPSVDFKPVVPLPELIEVKTGEEGEEKLFEDRAKLLRFDSEKKEWKEKGIGNIKIMKDPATGRVRLIMRREQVFKVCCNHVVTENMQFNSMKTSDRSWTWCAKDYSEGVFKVETLAIKFKTPEQAHAFKRVLDEVQKEMREKGSETEALGEGANTATRNNCLKCSSQNKDKCICSVKTDVPKSEQLKPLSELFKSKPGTWECSDCYLKNDSSAVSCISCGNLKPGASDVKVGSSPAAEANVGATDTSKSLSELFKPKVGSWECKGCYVRNDSNVVQCPACGANNPETEGKSGSKPTTTSFGFNFGISSTAAQTFSFGTLTTTTSTQSGLSATKPEPQFLFGVPQTSSSTSATYTFGVPASQSGGNFTFGATSTPVTTSASTGVFAFNFGSKDSTAQVASTTQLQEASTTTPFVFGNKPAVTPAAGLTFGKSQTPVLGSTFGSGFTSVSDTDPTTPKEESSPEEGGLAFTFGSPQKFNFSFSGVRPKSPIKSPKSPHTGGTDDDSDAYQEEDEGEHIYFQPLVPLPEKVPVCTGEEEEEVLYCHRAKLFRFVDGEWKERGIGDIKLLEHHQTGRIRLLMRRDQVLKLCLNHFLTSDIKFLGKDEKTWLWSAPDYSEQKIQHEKFAVRFKSKDIAMDFKDAIDKVQEKLKGTSQDGSPLVPSADNKEKIESPGPVYKTSPAMQNFKFTLDGSTSDSATAVSPISPGPFSLAARLGASNSAETCASVFGSPPAPKGDVVRKLFDSTREEDKGEIEVVYEQKVSEGKRDAAVKLQLPPNFYAYEEAPQCPGCRGCKDEIPTLAYETKQKGGTKEELKKETEPSRSTAAVEAVNVSIPTPSGDASSVQLLAPSSVNASQPKEPSFFNPIGTGLSFAALAQQQPAAFKTDPVKSNFIWSQQGSQVFGHLKKPTNEQEESSGDEGDADGSTHDPHFEPIVALPPTIEVKTGEEEEEKLFCQRAKLFRYDKVSKEWKERGIGEMKILKHPVNNTYRFLLRREQVHKVVCNHLINSDISLNPLQTSDKAWCWAAINYVEDRSDLEELAVRFKNSEIANEFFNCFNECKQELASRSSLSADLESTRETTDATGDDEYEEEEDEDDDEQVMLKRRCTMKVMEDGGDWEDARTGVIKILYDKELFSARIAMVEDETGDTLCDVPITNDWAIELMEKECMFCIFDTPDPYSVLPTARCFKAIFESEEMALEFHDVSLKGKQLVDERESDDDDDDDENVIPD